MSKLVRHFFIFSPGLSESVISPAIFSANLCLMAEEELLTLEKELLIPGKDEIGGEAAVVFSVMLKQEMM